MKYLIALLLTGCFLTSYTQNLELCRQVIGSIGGSGVVQGHNLAYTVGEPVISKIEDQGLILTQGFHQPELCLLVEVNNYEYNQQWDLQLFPNPTSTSLQLNWEGNTTVPAYQFQIFNSVGQQVQAASKLVREKQSIIDCSQLTSGKYYLSVTIPSEQQAITMPFIVAKQ